MEFPRMGTVLSGGPPPGRHEPTANRHEGFERGRGTKQFDDVFSPVQAAPAAISAHVQNDCRQVLRVSKEVCEQMPVCFPILLHGRI